jgi:16S rRNA G966 N2-methylase RsmD
LAVKPRVSNTLKEIPFVPTPHTVVEKMLQLAAVKPDEVVYDLGAGDGRIVFTAVNKFSAKGVAVELDPWRSSLIREKVIRQGLKERIEVRQEDLFQTTLRGADVVTLYLLPEANRRLSKKLLLELPSGARVVTHDYPIPGWRPIEVLNVKCDGKIHTLYLYQPKLMKRF